jgi:RimJ/RimL family protein N-acetyltransferase
LKTVCRLFGSRSLAGHHPSMVAIVSCVMRLTPPDPALADEVVELRPFTLDDIPAVCAACQDPEIPRWTAMPSPYTENHALTWINSHAELWEGGLGAPFAITLGHGGQFAGNVSLARVDWNQRVGFAGYWVASFARNRGVASHGLVLLCSWAFDSLGLARMVLHTMIGNVASERVATKAGFAHTRLLPDCPHPTLGKIALNEWHLLGPAE